MAERGAANQGESTAPRAPSAAVLLLWTVGAAAFGYASMQLLQQLGPIRSTATRLPGLAAAWFLGRRFAWLPTVSAMLMVPLLSAQLLAGPVKPGLGLRICKKLLARMGGRLDFSLGQGSPTRAVVTLPLTAAAPVDELGPAPKA